MNTVKKLFLAGLILVLGLTGSTAVGAVTATEDQLEVIRKSCPAAQTSLERVKLSDLVARTKRGRSYDSILELMRSLNTRLVASSVNATALVDLTNQLNTSYRDSFYDHYTNYAQAMDRAVRADCNQPQLFYSLLQDVRAKRIQINQDVIAIQATITGYQAAVAQLQADLQAAESSTEAP